MERFEKCRVDALRDGFKVDLVSKLSNEFLGQINVDLTLGLFKRLQDMQVQASRLMRHATRFPRDVLFWQSQTELLPRNFAYKERLEPHEEACIETLLQQAKQTKLSMMWNEDDSWAEQQTSKVQKVFVGNEVWVVCNKHLSLLSKSLLYFENQGVTKWFIRANFQTVHVVRHIGFLRDAQACQQVTIDAVCGIQQVRHCFDRDKLSILLRQTT